MTSDLAGWRRAPFTGADGLCLLGLRKAAHSVLTRDLREDPPNSAFHARTRTVEFLRKHLVATG